MRGTIHLLVAEDALVLRPWTQPRMEQEVRSSQNTRTRGTSTGPSSTPPCAPC